MKDLLLMFLVNIIRIEKYAILLRVLLSWVYPDPSSRLNRILFGATEPVLSPIRRILPRVSMIDFSPIVAFLFMDFAQYGIVRLFY